MEFGYERIGEHALLLHLGEGVDSAANARVHALCARLAAAPPEELEEWVSAYASVLLRFRPAADAQDPLPRWLQAVRAVLDRKQVEVAAEGALHRIPVCYGDPFGEDLAHVAAHTGLPEAEVVARHGAAEYRVAMLGFAPGFPYLLGMEPALHVSRRAVPRLRVPAGSVAIGGAQTGIYPSELPGGWQVIGRTPWRLFDPTEDPPSRLAPGDRVRFEAIDLAQFERLHRQEWGA